MGALQDEMQQTIAGQTTRMINEIMHDAFGASSMEEEEGQGEEGVRRRIGSAVADQLHVLFYFKVELYFQLDYFLYEVTNSNFVGSDVLS
jgi:hypothetical protein